LFKHLYKLEELGFPVLVGASRKTMIGQITGKEVNKRMAGSVALAAIAAAHKSTSHGVAPMIIRVHDVAETVDAIKMSQALT